jgi:hypothetical protein
VATGRPAGGAAVFRGRVLQSKQLAAGGAALVRVHGR